MLTQDQFNKKWEEIKGGLRNLWGSLSDEEMESTKLNLYELTDIIQKKHGESKMEINQKIHRLLDSFDNNTDKFIDPDVSSYHRSPL